MSARRLAFGAMLVSSLALAGFAAIVDVTTAFVLVGVQQAALGAAQSARAAIIGRAFTGEARVGARAVLRTVTNAGIAIGSAVAGAALHSRSPERRSSPVSSTSFACPPVWMPSRSLR